MSPGLDCSSQDAGWWEASNREEGKHRLWGVREVFGEHLSAFAFCLSPAESGSEGSMQFYGSYVLTVSQAQFLDPLTLGRVLCCHLRRN